MGWRSCPRPRDGPTQRYSSHCGSLARRPPPGAHRDRAGRRRPALAGDRRPRPPRRRARALRAAFLDSVASAEMLVVRDGVEDPHNLGAVIRTAHAAGAGAIVIPERRAAGITDVVAKAAAGALEHLPVVRVTNINRTLEDLKERGMWIYGLDERGTQAYDQIDYASRSVLVLGSEGGGLHEQVRKNCDVLVRIPLAGKISSLNVSVAAGVVLFEWKRRRK